MADVGQEENEVLHIFFSAKVKIVNDWIDLKGLNHVPFYYGSCQVETDCEGGMRSSDASSRDECRRVGKVVI